jgi:hypothetical protein
MTIRLIARFLRSRPGRPVDRLLRWIFNSKAVEKAVDAVDAAMKYGPP